MKKIFSILFVLTLLVLPMTVIASAETGSSVATYTFSDVSGFPGEEVSVEFSLKTDIVVNTIGVKDFTYDSSSLELLRFEKDAGFDAAICDFDAEKQVLAIATYESRLFDEVVGRFVFKIKESTVPGASLPVSATTFVTKNSSNEYASTVYEGSVSVLVSVTGVSLNKTSLSLEKGESATLTATVVPDNANNKNVTWSSDNTAVATVENGTVSAVGAGSATITVTTEDGSKKATCAVTVTETVDAKAVFTFSDVTGRPGETVDIRVSLKTEEKINTIVLSDFVYDKNLLTFEGFYDYDHIKDMSMLPPTFDEEKVAVVIGLAQNQVFDGDICTMRFKINPDALDGTTDRVGAMPLIKLSSVVVASKVVPSNVTVKTRLTGDIDGDEDVDIDDAVLLFQYSVLPDMYPIDYTGNVDFDKNGFVDIDDAVLLFQYSVLPDLYPIN